MKTNKKIKTSGGYNGNCIDISGQKFNRLTALAPLPKRGNGSGVMWDCICECGGKYVAKCARLRSGHTKSCGCLRREGSHFTHGLSEHPIYRIWAGIKTRCYNKSATGFEIYGERGVKMCDEWLNDFRSFYEWAIANGWSKGMDVDKDSKAIELGIVPLLYSPEWCRIVTRKENMQRTAKSVILEYNGKKQSVSQWAVELGMPYKRFIQRIGTLKWPIERAFTQPTNVRIKIK